MALAEQREPLQALLCHTAFWQMNLAYFDRVSPDGWAQPAGTPARSRGAPNLAALPPPVRCERSMLASSIPQT
jgi:hypothetical protein